MSLLERIKMSAAELEGGRVRKKKEEGLKTMAAAKAKVAQFNRAIGREEDVGRLHVAVHDARLGGGRRDHLHGAQVGRFVCLLDDLCRGLL